MPPSKTNNQTPATRARIGQLVPALLAWFRTSARDLPWRKARDPYAIWVSEIMLQQTQVAAVIPYYERWMRELPDISALAAATEQRLLKLWEGLGYYSRVRNLQRAACVIEREHGGVLPADYDQVLALPGVGRYTAGAICSIAFNQPTPILDGNVARVLARIFLVKGDARSGSGSQPFWRLATDLVRQASESHTPPACRPLNEALMELGAMVCLPRNPLCEVCPVATICHARLRNVVHRFPERRERVATENRRFVAFIITDGRRVIVRQRPEGTPNAGFWEFPSVEPVNSETPDVLLRSLLPGMRVKNVIPLGKVSHTIMNRRLSVEAIRVLLPGSRLPRGLESKSLRALRGLPLSTITRKVMGLLNQALREGSRG